VQTVNPGVNGQPVSPPPRILDDGRLTDVQRLLYDVQLAEAVRCGLRRDGGKNRVMTVSNVLDVPQPVIDQSEPVAVERRVYASAPVVTRDDHVADPQHVNRKLKHRQAVQIRVDNDVRNVAVDEELARIESDDLVGRNAAVRAPDPEILRRLLGGQTLEEIGPTRRDFGRPAAIVLEQVRQR